MNSELNASINNSPIYARKHTFVAIIYIYIHIDICKYVVVHSRKAHEHFGERNKKCIYLSAICACIGENSCRCSHPVENFLHL